MQTEQLSIAGLLKIIVSTAAAAYFAALFSPSVPEHAPPPIPPITPPDPAATQELKAPTSLTVVEDALRQRIASAGIAARIDASAEVLTVNVDGYHARLHQADVEALRIRTISDFDKRALTIGDIQDRCRELYMDDDDAMTCVEQSYTLAEKNLAKVLLLIERRAS